MNIEHIELKFPSSDGIHSVYAEMYVPCDVKPKGIIQLVHGMVDYTGRYKEMAEYMCKEGYIFAGHHHLGHGRTVEDERDFGFFADKGGTELVVSDTYRMNELLRERFQGLPVVILGHSMGSFITRLYVRKYPHTVKGAIIHGTGGPNPLLPMGKLLARVKIALNGKRHRSKLLTSLSVGAYNKKFPKEEGPHAWLTRDLSTVEDRSTDPYTSFTFTASGYLDLFRMLGECNSKRWFREYPKNLPTLIISGECDPVGNFGKGPRYVYKQLCLAGQSEVTLKTYEGARHELFNETCRAEVFSYLAEWIGGIIR